VLGYGRESVGLGCTASQRQDISTAATWLEARSTEQGGLL
jgi:hypothetical protein